MASIIQLVKDPYERQARVTPGLLVALPVLVPLICVYGPQHPMLTSVVGLIFGCGVIYALSSVARVRGKKLEDRLVASWGGMPTTIVLRHRNDFLDSISKKRYHDAVTDRLEISMPSCETEAADPAKADDVYVGATRKIREMTRGKKDLLLKENIAYGFHRNMLGMKPVGVATCLAGLAYGLLIADVIRVAPIGFEPENIADPGLAGGLTLAMSIALLAAWLLHFTEDTVRRVGFVYAERLLECLVALPIQKKSTV